MIDLEDSIEIQAPPERVFALLQRFFLNTEEYKNWHPDHHLMTWIKGEPNLPGSVCYCEETIMGHLTKLKYVCTEAKAPERVVFRPAFPLNLLSSGNVFLFESLDQGRATRFTASGRIYMSEKLFLKMSPNHARKLEETRLHMKAEGERLKALAESA